MQGTWSLPRSLLLHAGQSSYYIGPFFITLGAPNNYNVIGDQLVTRIVTSGRRGDTTITVCALLVTAEMMCAEPKRPL